MQRELSEKMKRRVRVSVLLWSRIELWPLRFVKWIQLLLTQPSPASAQLSSALYKLELHQSIDRFKFDWTFLCLNFFCFLTPLEPVFRIGTVVASGCMYVQSIQSLPYASSHIHIHFHSQSLSNCTSMSLTPGQKRNKSTFHPFWSAGSLTHVCLWTLNPYLYLYLFTSTISHPPMM